VKRKRVTFNEAQIERMKELYDSGLGCIKISRNPEFSDYNANQIKHGLNKANVPLRQIFGNGRPQSSLPISTKAQCIIDGMLLGDGCLFPISGTSVNSGFTATQTEKRKDFLIWLQTTLSQEGIPSKIYHRPSQELAGPSNALYTPRAKEFTLLRHMWYPKGIKLIPPSLLLSPIALMCWHKAGGITLYTNSFSNEDASLLIELLVRDCGIISNIHAHTPGKNSLTKFPCIAKPTIYIPVFYAKWFLNIIGPCPVPSLQYKWPGQ
jgi:hypothetical protein